MTIARSILVLALLLGGCATATVERTADTCTASYTSVFKDMSGVQMSGCGAKGGAENAVISPEIMQTIIRILAAP